MSKAERKSLRGLEPTEEELSAARAHLQKLSDKARRSKNGCLITFLKNNPEEKQLVEGTKGASREEWLCKYHIWQIRNRGSGTAQSLNSKSERSNRGVMHTLNWWSREKMGKELGESWGRAV